MTSVVASQISRLGFNVSKEWVDACVEFCQSQSQNLSGQALVNVVIGQWMDADITVEGTQSGPQIRENISPEVVKGPTLQGKFCLQVQKAIDVGQNSAYSQLQTALKVRNENTLVSADNDTQRPYTAAWEPKSKRMLRLMLTDGFKLVGALEFEPITQLHYPVPPGLKLELKGPILVRRGLLLLTPRNVKILGGRVSDLEETCSLVQQLTDVLGRDNVDPLLAESRVTRPRPVQNTAMTGSGDAVFDDAEDELFNLIDDPSINSTNSRPGQSGAQWNQAPGNRTTFPKVPSLAPIVPKASNVSTAATKPSKAPTIPKTRKISKSQSVKKEQAQLTQKKEPKAPKASTSKQPAKTKPKKLTASVWDDDNDDFPDDDSFLLCVAESEIDSSFKVKKDPERVETKVSQKRVPKMSLKSAPVKKSKRELTSEQFPDDENALFCQSDSWSAAEIKPTIKMSQNNFVKSQKKLQNIKTEIKQEPQCQAFAEFQDDDAFLASIDLLELAAPPNVASQSISHNGAKPNNYIDKKPEVSNTNKPYNYIINIDKKVDSVEIVKGCMVSLASKLIIVEGTSGKAWNVKVVVTDGSGMLMTSLSSLLILEMFGFSPADYSKMPPEQKKATMRDATSGLSSKLLKFNGLIKLKFCKSRPEPEIIELIPFNRGHLQQLKIRVNKTS